MAVEEAMVTLLMVEAPNGTIDLELDAKRVKKTTISLLSLGW